MIERDHLMRINSSSTSSIQYTDDRGGPQNAEALCNYSTRFLYRAISKYLCGIDYLDDFLSSGKYYCEAVNEMNEKGYLIDDLPERIRMIHTLILTGHHDQKVIKPFSAYSKYIADLKPYFFHTYSLSNYILKNREAIDEHYDEIILRELKKGGKHLVYCGWTKTIMSLFDEDVKSFEDGLHSILNDHEKMQRRGLWGGQIVLKEISLPALSLAKLAIEKNIRIDVSHPLLPVEFLNINR